MVVGLIAGLSFGATGAPYFSVEIRQANLAGRLRARAAANPGSAVDERQFVIFLQKDHHSVGQRDAFGFLRVKRRQGRNRDLLPLGRLSCSLRRVHAAKADDCEDQNKRRKAFQSCRATHCPPPFWLAGLPGTTVSIIPTVRFVGTKVWLATRRISALVTLSRLSTW